MSNIEIQDVSPEDRRKHLDFIQSVVNRMSAASAATKGWLLPVVTASYGYAVIKGSPQVAMLGVVALLLFGLLDANYLNQERCYRRLYDAVAQGGHIPPFAMNPALADRCAERGRDPSVTKSWYPPVSVWLSWSIAPFYGGLFLVGLVILFMA